MTRILLTFLFSIILITTVFAQDPQGFGDVSVEGSSEPSTTDEPNTRIVGGRIVTDSIVPFLANIHIYDKEELYSTCSGTVLGSQWILSAAHCFNFPGDEWDVNVARSYVSVGTADVDPSDDDFFYNMEKVYVHKRYDPSGMGSHNDVAIIKLATPITEGLYSVINIGEEPAPGTNVIVAGYGAVDDRLTETEFGKQATMVAQSFETCSDAELPFWKQYLRKDIMVCATSVGFPDKAETDICCKFLTLVFIWYLFAATFSMF